MRRLFSAIAFVLVLAPVSAQVESNFVMLAGTTSEPIGSYEYRHDRPREAALFYSINSTGVPARVVTSEQWESVVTVNEWVNTRMIPTSDQDHWDEPERWSIPFDGKGDCEDYVISKKLLLLAAGLPPSALLITIVRRPSGEGHALLMVRTTEGDYVLDNLTNEIKIWWDTEYTYVKQQSREYPGRWTGIADTRLQVSATPGAP